jgi:phosphoserine phosphatase
MLSWQVGAVKVTRLHEWLDRSSGGRAAVEVWAYGDSQGDAAMLADADRAIWVTER